MRSKLSFRFGSAVVVSSLLGGLSLLATSCGGDEPVNGTANTTDTNNTGADESSAEPTTEGQVDTGEAETDDSAAPGPTPTNSTDESTLPDTPAGTAIGIGCTEDTDCVSPLECVRTDDSFRGAFPGNGICTMPCTADANCQEVDLYGFCDLVGAPTDEAIAATAEGEIPEGMAPYCLQACPFGLSAGKCDSLATFTCTPIEAEVTTTPDGDFQFGLCLALCSGDDDCEADEHCDGGWGLCVPEEREGKELGEKCDPTSEVNECAGAICLSFTEDLPYGICSAPCNFHPDTVVCGGEPGTDATSGCFPSVFTELASTRNDLGQCLPLCDAPDDCPDSYDCDLSAAETFSGLYGRDGVCFPTEESIAEAISALSDGGGGGGDDTSEQPPPPNTDAGGGDGG